jgi:hypothetical protein
MQQKIRHQNNSSAPGESTAAPIPMGRGELPRSESARQARKPQGSQARAPGSLTARMIDYRSWWNLPAARQGKSHS